MMMIRRFWSWCWWTPWLVLAINGANGRDNNMMIARNFDDVKPRIVGGTNTLRNEFPFMVILVGRDRFLTCGGTLVSPTVVLTAAHCNVALLTYAWIGRWDFTDESEMFEEIPIVREIVHPDNDFFTGQFDVMLLQLEYPAASVNFVRLLQSPLVNVVSEGATMIAVGRGALGFDTREVPDILQKVELKYVPLEECRRSGGFYDQLTDDMMCTFEQDRDACNGDSGGPMLWYSGNILYQVGVISFGVSCADNVFPGVSISTSYIIDFVRTYACGFDGDSAPEYLTCDTASTIAPTPAPVPLPSPDNMMTWIWIVFFMDDFPEDIGWKLKDLTDNQDVAEVKAGEYCTLDEVRDPVQVMLGHSDRFTVEDRSGDGIREMGYYQIVWNQFDNLNGGPDEDGVTILVEGDGEFEKKREHVFEMPETIMVPPSPSPSFLPSAVPSGSPTKAPTDPEAQCVEFPYECRMDVPCCHGPCWLNGFCPLPRGIPKGGRTRMSRGRGGAGGRRRDS